MMVSERREAKRLLYGVNDPVGDGFPAPRAVFDEIPSVSGGWILYAKTMRTSLQKCPPKRIAADNGMTNHNTHIPPIL